MEKVNQVQDAKKSSAAAYKAEIDGLNETAQKLKSEVNSRTENRDVRCEVRHDYDNAMVTTIRTDTGEVVTERVMKLEERQVKMPFEAVEGGKSD